MRDSDVLDWLWRLARGKSDGPVAERLRHPAAWAGLPPELLAALEHRRPSPCRPGEVLLLATDEGQGWVGLLTDTGRPLEGEPAESLARAGRCAEREVPLLLAPDCLQNPKMNLQIKLVGNSRRPPEGESFGLALALARCSELLDQPLPADLVASATLAEDGGLGKVEGLSEKLRILKLWYPGVRRVLVHPTNAEEVRVLGFEVVPVVHLSAAIDVVFPPSDRLAGGVDPEQSSRLLDQLFPLALFDQGAFHGWAPLVATATRLNPVSPLSEWKKAAIIAIADRKTGGFSRMPSPPADLRRPLRLKVFAQQLQSINDCVEEGWEPLAEEAEGHLASPSEEDEWDLRLCGALGRLYLAWGQVQRAESFLMRALEGWADLYKLHHASMPLCALLHARAMTGRPPEVLELWAERLWTEPREDDTSRAFLALAMSRVSSGTGRLSWMNRVTDWEEKPRFLQASRLRWRCFWGEAEDVELRDFAGRYRREGLEQWLLLQMLRGEDPDVLARESTSFERELSRRRRVVAGISPRRIFEEWPY